MSTARAALVLALALAAPVGALATPEHDMSVRIDPATRHIDGRDSIRLDPGHSAELLLSAQLHVVALAADGHRIRAAWSRDGAMQRIALPPARRVDVRWSGEFSAPGAARSRPSVYGEPMITTSGTYLPAGSGWYPTVQGSLERYKVALDLPQGQRGLVPGRLVSERVVLGRYRARFVFEHPAEGITLLAGPYRVTQRRITTALGTKVRLRTYFHPQIASLANGYLDSVAGYLNRFEREIGPYPFSEFSIVSSTMPTGLGMPTLTYLGIDVLRLPFIRKTSLGHEVLHDWWGNGVYPDYASGNWCEGLTTFMADYAFQASKGKQAAVAARLAWLRDYAAMPRSEDTAVVHFTERTHGATQVVGYEKTAMVFFMLRDEIGARAFERGLKRFWRRWRFRVASWSDLRRAFEHASGRDLRAFFDQWIDRIGAPALRIANAQALHEDGGWRLKVTLEQGTPAYALSVPLSIRTGDAALARRVPIDAPRETVSLDLPEEPLAVVLDPEYRLFRRLAASEAPPILRDAMLAGSPMMFALSADPGIQSEARELAARFFDHGTGARAAKPAAPVTLVVGLHADIDEWLANSGMVRPARLAENRGTAQVWTQRAPGGRVTMMVSVRDAASLHALLRPLPHYGRESWLVFDGARAIARGVWPAKPQTWKLEPAVH